MELIIKNTTEQKPIEFNYEQLKTQIQAKAGLYENMVYDDNHVKDAKADRAALNKFKTALEQKRREVKKECLKPYEDFETKVNDLINIINSPINIIDTQIKDYESAQKIAKEKQINDLYSEIIDCDDEVAGILTYDGIFDDKWLNKTTSLKKIREDMEGLKEKVKTEVKTIEALPSFSFEAMDVYKKTLNLGSAIIEVQRLTEQQKRKEEHEVEMKRRAEEQQRMAEQKAKAEEIRRLAEEEDAKEKAENEVEEPVIEVVEVVEEPKVELRKWMNFSALLSVDEAKLLANFFNENSIEFKPFK